MKNFINFILELLGLRKKEKDTKPSVSKPKPTVEPQPKPESKPLEPKAKEEEKKEKKKAVPKKSNPNAKITTFLWKPESDNDGKVVILVKCDGMRPGDIKMELFSSKGTKLKINQNAQPNLANGDRIHFRPGKVAKSLKKQAPLSVKFFHKLDGKKQYIIIRTRKQIKISAPQKRKDLK